jgi:hypothetical protein
MVGSSVWAWGGMLSASPYQKLRPNQSASFVDSKLHTPTRRYVSLLMVAASEEQSAGEYQDRYDRRENNKP